MHPRDLSFAEIQAWLARLKYPRAALLRILAVDARRTVRALAARYDRRREAAYQERLRLRRLYRTERERRTGQLVAGVDEVGRGCLAGPVVAAAVILPEGRRIKGLDDSKQLARPIRERLDKTIRSQAIAVAVAEASVEEINRLNILGASRVAMRRALEALIPPPNFALVDGRDRLPLDLEHAAVVRGDASCACVAAASIVAKVARDRFMDELDRAYPGYGFARHKGYGTDEHLAALGRLGPSRLHRSGFLPVVQAGLFEWP